VVLTSNEKKVVLKRVRYLKGQINGVERMLENDRTIVEIIQQLKAVESALHQALYVVLDEQLKKQLATALVNALEACPGECAYCDRLNLLKRKFANFSLQDVVDTLMQISKDRLPVGAPAFSSSSVESKSPSSRAKTKAKRKNALKHGRK
jgi:DNA-binding FrmR family transcriptional regulator